MSDDRACIWNPRLRCRHDILDFALHRGRAGLAAAGLSTNTRGRPPDRITRMRKVYRGTDIEVSFDLDICIHIGECLRGQRAVFQLDRRPWVLPDEGDPDTVAGSNGARAGRSYTGGLTAGTKNTTRARR
jgi:uncharacterized Fe-S cluster protein YjdI